jgi:hypothetical protein
LKSSISATGIGDCKRHQLSKNLLDDEDFCLSLVEKEACLCFHLFLFPEFIAPSCELSLFTIALGGTFYRTH